MNAGCTTTKTWMHSTPNAYVIQHCQHFNGSCNEDKNLGGRVLCCLVPSLSMVQSGGQSNIKEVLPGSTNSYLCLQRNTTITLFLPYLQKSISYSNRNPFPRWRHNSVRKTSFMIWSGVEKSTKPSSNSCHSRLVWGISFGLTTHCPHWWPRKIGFVMISSKIFLTTTAWPNLIYLSNVFLLLSGC